MAAGYVCRFRPLSRILAGVRESDVQYRPRFYSGPSGRDKVEVKHSNVV